MSARKLRYRICTPEHRAALAAAKRRHWQDPAYREKAIAAMRQRRHSPESRAKISAARKTRPPDSAETRARKSASARAAWTRRQAAAAVKDHNPTEA